MAEYEEFYGKEEYAPFEAKVKEGGLFGSDVTKFSDPLSDSEYQRRQRYIQDVLRERQASLSGLEAQQEALLGGIAGEREAAEASIRAARQGAARAMMGLAGGTGGLAGSGAVRAGLAQSGFQAAEQEQLARQTAAKNIMGIETKAEGMRGEIEAARTAATLEALEDEALREADASAKAEVAANIGGGQPGIERAIDILMMQAEDSPFPRVRNRIKEYIDMLSRAL